MSNGDKVRTRVRRGVLRAALVVAFLTTAVFSAVGQTPTGLDRPNIVLIMADDLGYECLSVNGGRSYETPHLDALASAGVRFTHCYSTPLCTPSRVQLLTGQYNFRNYTQFAHMDLRETTFAHLLQKAGYRTAIAGKWQLAGDEQAPHRAGFDEYCLWQAAGRRGSRYTNPQIIENGKWREGTRGKYGPDVVCDYLIDFIGRHRDRPFLAYYPMLLPHAPLEPTPDSKSRDKHNYFADMVAYMDKNVGRIVRRIDELKLSNRTIVIFTGDNGANRTIRSQFNDRWIQGGKGTPTGAGTHVPLIVRWQGHSPAGAVNADLIDFSDFLPSLCDAAGVILPSEKNFDGRSFLPQMLGREGTPRSWVFCYYEPKHGNVPKAVFAHDKRYKLYDDGRFFDITADPAEENRLTDREATAARQKLQAVLELMAREAERAKQLGH